MAKSLGLESLIAVRYPPYTSKRMNMLRMFMVSSPTIRKIKSYSGLFKKFAFLILLIALYLKRA